ncbi:TRAP transporter solute receptor, TAXI family [Meiothermus granaticius NBRC 107808]|uniref:TRAP transporter solute receptor, TAXI family n=2 Tax=Meiothermus TaxID=65551 RepID=A0A399F7B4_9DEIN|nr:TRAP transporter solute receptor, TAXI family [Meiothermus granaticius NBRC 107808]
MMRKALQMLIFSNLLGLALAQPTVVIGAGNPTGILFHIASALAERADKAELGIRWSVKPTDGGRSSLEGLATGELQMALVGGDVAYYAYNGTGLPAFEKKPLRGLKSVAYLFPEVVHILVRAGQGIHTPADLKGRKVAMGEPGSPIEVTARLVLGVYGLGSGDVQPAPLSPTEGLAALQDGRVDAAFYIAPLGDPAVQRLAARVALQELLVEPSRVEALSQKYPFYTPVLLPGRVYPGIDVTTPAIGIQVVLLASEYMSADLLRSWASVIFGNEAALRSLEPVLAGFSAKTAVRGLPAPLHPGAERYWVERGVIPLQ